MLVLDPDHRTFQGGNDRHGGVETPPGLMDLVIRRLREGDAVRLSRFYASLSEQTRHFYQPFSATDVEAMEGVVQRALDGQDLSLIALEPGERVIAHFFYQNVSEPVPYLGIGLRDDYQGLGLGAALLAYLIGLGRSVLRKQAIALSVMKENRRALHLYRKFGFKVVREITFREPNDSYEMSLDLEKP